MASLEQILRELADPAAYPHPVEAVRVVQTHISCVFLTGEYAYKVKKPVNFGWLHYETLAQRRHCTEEEIRLNRRLCPEVYEGVVPIVEAAGRLRVGGKGEPVEWALRMRQMREADLLPARLAQGSVPEEEIHRLARLLAQFHAGAETGPEVRRWGTAESERGLLAQALPETPAPEAVLPTAQREAITGYLYGFLQRNEALFDQRAVTDRVREGHGDLRLQNICLDPRFQQGIQIFDCLEFNARFRCLDVLSDLAYLVTDLDLHGEAAFRHVLVREYQARAKDPDLERLLPFFRCFRACIRGKIALLAAGETEVPPEEQEAHRHIAAAAFDLALALSRPPETPVLWVMVGLSGTGKSTVARELARRFPAVHLSSDRVRKELAGVPPEQPLPADWYSTHRIGAVYDELRTRAREWLGRGESVILDATFHRRGEQESVEELARAAGARLRYLECSCHPETVNRRLLARRPGEQHSSDAGPQVYRRQYAEFEPPSARTAALPYTTLLDTSRPASELARSLIGAG